MQIDIACHYLFLANINHISERICFTLKWHRKCGVKSISDTPFSLPNGKARIANLKNAATHPLASTSWSPLHYSFIKQTPPLWNDIHNAFLILQSNNNPSSTVSMSFDAKHNLTRFKISFRSGFSGSLQIVYSLLYASALIYITPSLHIDFLANQ